MNTDLGNDLPNRRFVNDLKYKLNYFDTVFI